MELQTTFYIIGIIFMVVMLLLIIGIFAAVLVIKAKINHVHQTITDKVNAVKGVTDKGASLFRVASHFVKRKV